MKTLKYFNSLLPEHQCDWVVKLLDDASSSEELRTLIQDGEKQGENKDNLVKLLLLLKSIKKDQMTLLEDIKPVWIQTVKQMVREDKLNQIL